MLNLNPVIDALLLTILTRKRASERDLDHRIGSDWGHCNTFPTMLPLLVSLCVFNDTLSFPIDYQAVHYWNKLDHDDEL